MTRIHKVLFIGRFCRHKQTVYARITPQKS
jgi:hypothetical protein